MRIRNFAIVAFLLTVSILVTYWILPKTFFQQDEWWAFGIFTEREQKGGIFQVFFESLFKSGRIHVNPLTELILYFEYTFFYMDFGWYAVVSIALHTVNALLVYTFTHMLINKRIVSFFAALLFATSSIAHQAVSWVATSINTQGSILFSLASAIFLMKRSTIVLSYISVFIALLFKETALPFLLLPTIIKSGKKHLNTIKRAVLPLGIITGAYIALRIVIWFLAPPITYGVSDDLPQPSPIVHAYRVLTIPLKTLAESVVPMQILLDSSRLLVRLAYPHFVGSDGAPNPYLVEYAGLDLIVYVVSAILLVLFFWSYHEFVRRKKLHLATALIISLIIIVASTLLVIFIPGKAGYVSIIEPRHLYGATIGSSMLTVLALYALMIKIKTVWLKYFLFAAPIVVIALGHMRLVQNDLQVLYERSALRRSFLETIESKYTALPKRIVFYVESDTAYYGLPAEITILPVQSGFGRMLMVWYQKKEHFPGCLYENAFLHGIDDQGYRYCNGRGVGYYRNYKDLLTATVNNRLNPNEIIAYSWMGRTAQFVDITSETRTKIARDVGDSL